VVARLFPGNLAFWVLEGVNIKVSILQPDIKTIGRGYSKG